MKSGIHLRKIGKIDWAYKFLDTDLFYIDRKMGGLSPTGLVFEKEGKPEVFGVDRGEKRDGYSKIGSASYQLIGSINISAKGINPLSWTPEIKKGNCLVYYDPIKEAFRIDPHIIQGVYGNINTKENLLQLIWRDNDITLIEEKIKFSGDYDSIVRHKLHQLNLAQKKEEDFPNGGLDDGDRFSIFHKIMALNPSALLIGPDGFIKYVEGGKDDFSKTQSPIAYRLLRLMQFEDLSPEENSEFYPIILAQDGFHAYPDTVQDPPIERLERKIDKSKIPPWLDPNEE